MSTNDRFFCEPHSLSKLSENTSISETPSTITGGGVNERETTISTRVCFLSFRLSWQCPGTYLQFLVYLGGGERGVVVVVVVGGVPAENACER